MDIITKLYIGLNDKDTKKQEHSLDSFKAVLDLILFEHGYNAYTLECVDGCYKGDIKTTVIITLVNVNPNIRETVEDIKQSFNQECVMVEQYQGSVRFI